MRRLSSIVDESVASMTLHPTQQRSVTASVLALAAREAQAALMNGWREVVDCPRCTHGSVTIHGSMWWQTTKHRCHSCRGTGRVFTESAQETSGQFPSNAARLAEWPENIPDSLDAPASNAEAKND